MQSGVVIWFVFVKFLNFLSIPQARHDSIILNHLSGDKNQAITVLEKRISLLEHQIIQLTKKYPAPIR